MKIIVTFGSDHVHTVGGVLYTYGHDAYINCDDYEQGRRLAFAYFGSAFCTTYSEEDYHGHCSEVCHG